VKILLKIAPENKKKRARGHKIIPKEELGKRFGVDLDRVDISEKMLMFSLIGDCYKLNVFEKCKHKGSTYLVGERRTR
jgi:hypothetical protein